LLFGFAHQINTYKKMWKRLNNLLQTNTKEDKKDDDKSDNLSRVLKLATAEIDMAIQKNETLLFDLNKNKINLQHKLQLAQDDLKKAENELFIALKNNDKFQTSLLLTQKANCLQKQQEFEMLYTSVVQTIQQIDRQVQSLHLQKEDITTKEIVLNSQLQSANNQKELQKYLKSLELSDEMESFEHEILKAETELALSKDVLSLDDEILRIENGDDARSIDTKFNQEKQQLIDLANLKNQKRIEAIFQQGDKKVAPPKEDLIRRRQEILAKFTQSQAVEKKNTNVEKQDKVNSFFENLPDDKQEKKENILKQFFDKTENQTSIENKPSKEDIFKQFFKDQE